MAQERREQKIKDASQRSRNR